MGDGRGAEQLTVCLCSGIQGVPGLLVLPNWDEWSCSQSCLLFTSHQTSDRSYAHRKKLLPQRDLRAEEIQNTKLGDSTRLLSQPTKIEAERLRLRLAWATWPEQVSTHTQSHHFPRLIYSNFSLLRSPASFGSCQSSAQVCGRGVAGVCKGWDTQQILHTATRSPK